MKIACIQLNAGNNKTANINKALAFVRRAIYKKAELICLPEMFNYRGPFSTKSTLDAVLERIPGESSLPFIEIARQQKVSILLGSIYEKIPGKNKAFNTSLLISKTGTILAKYRKIHLFDAIVDNKHIRESKLFMEGRKRVVASLGGLTIGMSVCYDLRFPELYQFYAREHCEVVTVPSSFTYRTGKAHWEVLLRARAIENHVFVIAPNQTGKDGRGVLSYGNSMIISPWGDILARGSHDQEEVLYADVERKSIVYVKKTFGKI